MSYSDIHPCGITAKTQLGKLQGVSQKLKYCFLKHYSKKLPAKLYEIFKLVRNYVMLVNSFAFGNFKAVFLETEKK